MEREKEATAAASRNLRNDLERQLDALRNELEGSNNAASGVGGLRHRLEQAEDRCVMRGPEFVILSAFDPYQITKSILTIPP